MQAFADRPSPALTPSQRYHLDLFGYVVVERTLAPAEAAALLGELRSLRDGLLELNAGKVPPQEAFGRERLRGAYLGGSVDQTSLVNLVQTGGAITGYVSTANAVVGAGRALLWKLTTASLCVCVCVCVCVCRQPIHGWLPWRRSSSEPRRGSSNTTQSCAIFYRSVFPLSFDYFSTVLQLIWVYFEAQEPPGPRL